MTGKMPIFQTNLAQHTGNDASVISKQLAVMRKAGVIINPRGRLPCSRILSEFEIAPQFLTDKPNRTLDFGWCLLRMNLGN